MLIVYDGYDILINEGVFGLIFLFCLILSLMLKDIF